MISRPRFRDRQAASTLPHVMVDSLPQAGTALLLSHWPSLNAPGSVHSDTSTGMVFDWLAQHGSFAGLLTVTARHFDLDGLLALHAVQSPGAMEEQDAWRRIARAGDFLRADEPTRRQQAALSAECRRQQPAAGEGAARTALHFERMLAWLGDHGRAVLQRPPEQDWIDAVRRHDESAQVLRSADVQVLSDEAADLCTVVMPSGPLTAKPDQPTVWTPYLGVDSFALHALTEATNVLVVTPWTLRCVQRYEGWVQAADPAWSRRKSLATLALQLSEELPAARWCYPGVHHPFATLEGHQQAAAAMRPFDGESLHQRFAHYLRSAPVAWHPQRTGPGAASAPAHIATPC